MSTNAEKITGILLVIISIAAGFYYIYCILINGGVPNLLMIPPMFLLNSYWVVALPIAILVVIVIVIGVWLGIATAFHPKAKISEEELRKIMEMEKNKKK